jgi:anti-anti-sigma regulatory factor
MTAPQLIAIATCLTAHGQHLVIDLSNATFLDASMVRALLEADRVARERGRELVVQLGGSGFAERVLGITGADKRLVTANSRRGALQLVAAPA